MTRVMIEFEVDDDLTPGMVARELTDLLDADQHAGHGQALPMKVVGPVVDALPQSGAVIVTSKADRQGEFRLEVFGPYRSWQHAQDEIERHGVPGAAVPVEIRRFP